MLVTFMSRGRVWTPPHIGASNQGYQQFQAEDVGESGRRLEFMVFGGMMEYYRDSQYDGKQVRYPYLNTQQRNRS